MSETTQELSGPDFGAGISLDDIADGAMLLGQAHGEAVLLARHGAEVFAIGATCTHYGGPLIEGLLVGDTVRCPWHHACFSLRSGEPVRPPALNPVSRWRVERQGRKLFVRDKLAEAVPEPLAPAAGTPTSVVIVGGGAAGNAAAETLRREGYGGRITVLSADDSVPYDRPNLSKAYLAGTAPEEWIPLRSPEFYAEHGIELKLGARVVSLDTAGRKLGLADGGEIAFDALLLAIGAEPIRLQVPGGNLPHVHSLRTLADSRALVARAASAKRAVVVGASFIGLEVAAALRARGIEVHVVGLEKLPMEQILGAPVGRFVRRLHETHGVVFHLETTVTSIDERSVRLKNGEDLAADFVVAGVGVRPALEWVEQAGLAVDRGITVDAYLQTSVPSVFAAGDAARWPDRLSGERIRVEHWVVAERQGQTAARNILGRRERFDAVPFFWTEQYDFTLAYVGHAAPWDEMEFEGRLDLETRDCRITYKRGDEVLAVAVVRRDREGLLAEVDLERAIATRT